MHFAQLVSDRHSYFAVSRIDDSVLTTVDCALKKQRDTLSRPLSSLSTRYNKTLSYRREAVRCLVLLNIFKSLKAALSRRINMVTFANLGSVRLPSTKFEVRRARKIRRI